MPCSEKGISILVAILVRGGGGGGGGGGEMMKVIWKKLVGK